MEAREWKIVIDPRSKDSDLESITIAYLPDKESAEIDAEAYAELISLHGGVGGWAMGVHPSNFIIGAVVRRLGKATWMVRLDAYEHETETGYDQGFGYLRVREV